MRRFSGVVDGDYMEPKYRHGEVVIFAVDVELGGVVDRHNTFKRVFANPVDPERLVLRCWNRQYPERAVPRSGAKLIAPAIYNLVPDACNA